MGVNVVAVDNKEAFMGQLAEIINERLSGSQARQVVDFAQVYFSQSDIAELEGKALSDIFGNVFSWWNFIQQFDGVKPKVRVFNPSLEEHGWLSGHTVVAVLQRDMPFLVDSLRIEINRRDISLHAVKSTVVSVVRDGKGNLQEVLPSAADKPAGGHQEALVYLEINLHTDAELMLELSDSLRSVLRDVETVVNDYRPVLAKVQAARDSLALVDQKTVNDVQEADEFLAWLANGHFTFLGHVEYQFEESNGERALVEKTDSRLGLFRMHGSKPERVKESAFNEGMAKFHSSDQALSFSKSSVRSRVHRHAYSDYVVVKVYDQQGKVKGESRFIGLYTSPVYTLSPTKIPYIRRKVEYVLQRSGLPAMSHDGKALKQILETFPRDELLQSSEDELFEIITGVARIKERHMVRLFMRRDPYGKFVSCIVYVPRDEFSTQIRIAIQNLIGKAIDAEEHEFTTYFSESVLARTHIVFRVKPETVGEIDVKRLEKQVVDITRSWEDQFYAALCETYGEEKAAKLYAQYEHGFSSGYKENYEARSAVQDLASIAGLSEENSLAMSFYQPMGAEKNSMRFKVFHQALQLELSAVIPVLENLGLRVVGEHPYKIKGKDGSCYWMHDFDLRIDLNIEIDAHKARNNFQDAFAAIWRRQSDNDAFNRLVLGARINWREVVLLRAYASYMKQTMFNFSDSYIANTLANHLDITRNLVALFKSTFDPRVNQAGDKNSERVQRLKSKLIESLDSVDNLNEDRIIRRYIDFIQGTLRTNFFQTSADGKPKNYLSFKFSPQSIAEIPEPRPLYEIFVYSPRVEGVHLRGGPVARGGLRWSDRLQDYRTEVLGLVKAQQVKNAVIVPSGAKGGFVAKQLPSSGGREAFMKEGIACYQTFIRGLLDITDNIVDGDVLAPANVIRMDGDDPYLVVAADKGTATFSDIANAISAEYNHWLGDAFASGGSQGYDHKGMGITARGAWVSVQRHFKERGINVQREDFTVIGIGDMAGDVFGNGMLMSEHICLTAAFNHQHIFIDPNPDAARSFVERQRLFNTAGLNWGDYDKTLLSEGGEVFSRAAKSIPINHQMQQRFDISADKLTPNELICALLKAPVDLIWNGGIGTYVKSSKEAHSDVGDKANDGLRVNGNELRCKVFGEGGNLGMTQLGRVEYCLQQGACNTDFIDNAAGVDCSDHEVNIKILLDGVVRNGDLTQKQRNSLLEKMTDTVAELVLYNNYKQTQAISLSEFEAASRVGEYRRFINQMVASKRLNRGLEFIPKDEQIIERQQMGKALTRPELSVLISYAKVELKELLADEQLTGESYVVREVESAFPMQLRKKYREQIYNHRLRKEIVATQVANDMVNHMGINFTHRMMESTGSSAIDVAKAYVVARDVYRIHDFFSAVEKLDFKVDSDVQMAMLGNMKRRMRRATRWFLRNRRGYLSAEQEVAAFAEPVQAFLERLPEAIVGEQQQIWQQECTRLTEQGVPEKLAALSALPTYLYTPVNIIEASRLTNAEPILVAKVYFNLGNILGLPWFANQIYDVKVENYWQAMARETYLDDLESQMRTLSTAIIKLADGGDLDATIQTWMETQALLIDRWKAMMNELHAAPGTDYAMFSVALRELLDLVQASQHSSIVEGSSVAMELAG